MIEVRDLHYRYDSGVEALSGVTFSARAGQITAVLGPNGSGKSTCFKLLSTQLTLDRGDAQVCGASLRTQPDQVRSLLAVTFQSPALDPWLTVDENLRIHRTLWPPSRGADGVPKGDSDSDKVLALLGVADLRHRRVKTLSGGQARRVELSKVLMGGPRVLLLDEPTTGLDPSARKDFWAALSELKNRSMTILVTTHLFEEAALADHLVFLSSGQVADEFDTQELRVRQVARFSGLDREPNTGLRSSVEKTLLELGLKGRWQGEQCFVDLPHFAASASLLQSLSRLGDFDFQVGAWSLADLYFEKTGKSLK